MIRHSKLLRQFIRWYSLLVVAPSLLLVLTAYIRVRSYAYRDMRASLSFDIEKGRNAGDEIFRECSEVLQHIATSEEIGQIFFDMRQASRNDETVRLNYLAYYSLKPALNSLLLNESYIDDVLILMDDRCVYAHSGSAAAPDAGDIEMSDTAAILLTGNLANPFGIQGNWLCAARAIRSSRGIGNEPVCTVALLVDQQKLTSELAQYLRYEDSFMALVNADASTDILAQVSANGANGKLTEEVLELSLEKEEHAEIEVEADGKNVVMDVCMMPSEWSGLRYLLFTPISNAAQIIAPVAALGIMWVVLMLLSLSLFVLVYSRYVMKPLVNLAECVREVGQGNLDAKTKVPGSRNEIREVSEGFNGMLKSLKELMKKIRTEEEKKRQYQLAMLKYQINPHFLYNTINSIRFIAMMHEDDETAGMLVTLSRLLRHTLSNTDAMVPFAYELKNLQDYMELMNIRYSGRLCFSTEEVNIPEDALVPMTTLQPIIENAIIHGLSLSLNSGQQATVWLSGSAEGSRITIEVRDEGEGMSAEQAQGLLLREQEVSSRHIGLANIHHRIRLLFGEEYGLAIENSPGKGTKVRVRLPYRTEQEATPELDKK